MPLFTRTIEPEAPFTKNEVVKATVDLPGVPAGTTGRIKVINGFEWRRYWVFFDNGVEVGQLDDDELVRPQHWDHFFEERARRAEAEAKAAEAAEGATSDGDGPSAAAAADDANDPLARIRAMVPPHLLERSRAARERLGR